MSKNNISVQEELKKVFSRPIAHRGLHDITKGIVENSSSAFDLAIQNNYTIEFDLQLSKDDVPMVFHDETLDRVTDNTGKINEHNAQEITKIYLTNSSSSDKIQTLLQLLRQIDGRVALAIELKPQANKQKNEILAKSAVEMLENYSGSVAFISFVPDLLIFTKKHGFKGTTGIIVEHFISDTAKKHLSPFKRFILRHMLHYPKTRFDFVDANYKALDLPAVRLFRKFGFLTAAWTVKSQMDAYEALKHCDQIAFEGFLPKERLS